MSWYGILRMASNDHPSVKVTSKCVSGNDERFELSIDYQAERKVVIFEFQMSKSEVSLEDDAQNALQQIQDKIYTAEYRDYECLLIGVSFYHRKMSVFKAEIIQPM